MSDLRSRRPDLPRPGKSYWLRHEWRLVKSGRRELKTDIYATDSWHPFFCS